MPSNQEYQEAEMCTFPVTIDEEKLKAVDFLDIMIDNDLVIGSKIEKHVSHGDIIDELLKAEWKIFFLLMISIAFVTYFITLVNLGNQRLSFLHVGHIFLSYLLNEGSPSTLRNTPSRLVVAFFLVFVIVFNVSVFANLKTNLVSVDHKKINSLKALIEHKEIAPMIIKRGGEIKDAFKLSSKYEYQALLKKASEAGIYGQIEVQDDPLLLARAIRKIASGESAFVGERYMSYSLGTVLLCPLFPDLNLHVVHEDISGTMYGMPIRKFKDTKIKKTIQFLTRRYDEAGLAKLMLNLWVGGQPSCFGEFSDTDVTEVTEMALTGFRKTFYLMFIGWLVAFLLFLVEIFIGKSSTNK